MSRFHFLQVLALTFSLIAPVPAAAQQPGHDSGEYLILGANYGTERHHVDVTQRLREEAGRSRLFRPGNRVFGVDPDPGVAKVLRIYALGPNGKERLFEYREDSEVDGAKFRGWNRGERGSDKVRWNGRWNLDEGEFLILSAQYGTPQRHLDVTSRLKELAQSDREFQVGNGSFRADPHPGMVKVLRIYARGPNGKEHMFEYREGSEIDGTKFRGWNRGEWGSDKDRWSGRWNLDEGEFLILSAQYGTQQRHVDVTARLKELAQSDREFRVGNGSFGADPHPGMVKVLRIYARGPNGKEQMFEYREDSLVDGRKFRGWGRGEWGTAKDRWSGHWDGEQRSR